MDDIPELKGAGLILKFPVGDPFLMRPSDHPSGLRTYVVFDYYLPPPPETKSWWGTWNGVILNCGGAVLSGMTCGASIAAEPGTAGAATPVVIWSCGVAAAGTTQCLLSVGKVASNDFDEYVQSTDGQWINTLDLAPRPDQPRRRRQGRRRGRQRRLQAQGRRGRRQAIEERPRGTDAQGA